MSITAAEVLAFGNPANQSAYNAALISLFGSAMIAGIIALFRRMSEQDKALGQLSISVAVLAEAMKPIQLEVSKVATLGEAVALLKLVTDELRKTQGLQLDRQDDAERWAENVEYRARRRNEPPDKDYDATRGDRRDA